MISEEVRRVVLERDGHACQFFHTSPYQDFLEIFHVHHQGMGGRPTWHELNQPDNLITACHHCHARFHGQGAQYKVVHFDPNDSENGLIVIRRGQEVPKYELWFYLSRWKKEKAAQEMARFQELAQMRKLSFWLLAKYLSEASQQKKYRWLGEFNDVYELGAEVGLTSGEVRVFLRAWKFAQGLIEIGVVSEDELFQLDPRIMNLLAGFPDRAEEIISHALTLHPADFWRWVDMELKRLKRLWPQRGWVVKTPVKEVLLAGEDVPLGPDEVLIKGGTVIGGVRRIDAGEGGENEGA